MISKIWVLIMIKTAIVTGVSGQDGVLLTKFLINKGYKVLGLSLYGENDYFEENENFILVKGDVLDKERLHSIFEEHKPSECYHFAAISSISQAFAKPDLALEVNFMGTLNILETIRTKLDSCKLFIPCSVDMYGTFNGVINEQRPLTPVSPYGVSKAASMMLAESYRQSYGLFVCCGILTNHESEYRGPDFVTKKIVSTLVKIRKGEEDCLFLGNMNSKRDWGYAGDYVEAMWMMLQNEVANDYVVSTGETHTVREFVEEACAVLGFELEWQGSGLDEVGIDKKTGKKIISIDSKFFRHSDINLESDSSKIREELNWEPKTKFKELVRLMVEHER